jgi:hypothetical protein
MSVVTAVVKKPTSAMSHPRVMGKLDKTASGAIDAPLRDHSKPYSKFSQAPRRSAVFALI